MSDMTNVGEFTGREFRDALGLFATGVAVITATTGGGERLGTTVSSFNSVSLEPPLILFSIGRNARAFPAWEAVSAFGVNLLAEDQGDLSTRFARAMTDKWQGVEPHIGRSGIPLLPGALAWLECASYAKHDGGDHLIFVGQVHSLVVRKVTNPRPLLFFGGKYRQLETQLHDTPAEAAKWLHGW